MECYRRTDYPEYQKAEEALSADLYGGGSNEHSAIVSNAHNTAFEKADSSHTNDTSGALLKNLARFARCPSCETMRG